MWLILTLLIASITAALVIRARYNVYMLALVSPVIALVSAMATRFNDFTFWAGSAVTFACITAMQLVYMLVTWLNVGPEPSGEDPGRPRHAPAGFGPPLTGAGRRTARLRDYTATRRPDWAKRRH